jgi:hypothetical protein
MDRTDEGTAVGPTGRDGHPVTLLWRAAPWLSRLPLLAGAMFFLFLAGQWLVDPAKVRVLTESGIALGSAAAVTNMRGTGALFVPLAAILVACSVSTSRVLLGLRLLTTILAGAFAVRCAILLVDGPTPLLLRILRAELAMIALSGAALLLETARRRREGRAATMARAR